MAGEKLLIVEDERALLKILRYNLEREGYKVAEASDGAAALAAAKKEKPDLVLLDVMLPGLSGFEVCKALRREGEVPVIFLTARKEELDRVLGLELGADDYITKPFSVRELLARVKAVLKRTSAPKSAGPRRFGTLAVDFERYETRLGAKLIELTPAELKLLKVLVDADGKALSRDAVMERLYGPERSYELDARSVDQLVARLREKLGGEAARLVTVKNVGYRFRADP
ncbi:MAG: response regulator transcription factor [Elusimicrobia bacterium]|nr:response regulator transcription factor [Elusimicrobiota bacterium]